MDYSCGKHNEILFRKYFCSKTDEHYHTSTYEKQFN